MSCQYCVESPEEGKCIRDGCAKCCGCGREIKHLSMVAVLKPVRPWDNTQAPEGGIIIGSTALVNMDTGKRAVLFRLVQQSDLSVHLVITVKDQTISVPVDGSHVANLGDWLIAAAPLVQKMSGVGRHVEVRDDITVEDSVDVRLVPSKK